MSEEELSQRHEDGFEDESEGEKADVSLTDPVRQGGALYQIGDEVQMDVTEQDSNGREVQFAKRFFIHNVQYNPRTTRWMYQLNEEENGKAGAPWRQHKWVGERPLSPVL